MVGLIIKSPLAQGNVSSTIFDHLDHLSEVLLFLLIEFLIVLCTSDVNIMLGLRLWRLEGAGENADLRVLDQLRHLGVRDLLIDKYALDEGRFLDGATSLRLNLDEVEVHVLPLQVGHLEDSVNCDLGELQLVLRDHLRAQSRHGRVDERLVVLGGNVNFLAN